MPLWLDMLRTPMAAPETRSLKAMRRVWLFLCVTLAATVRFLEPLRSKTGRGAVAMAAALLLAAVAVTILYLRAKLRADNAWLDRPGESE